MSVIRNKNNVPEIYVSESRDFQLFTRVLDFVHNSIKFDTDSILNVISTDDIQEGYLERLKSKLGFFTKNYYPDEELRLALCAFPYILKYKGSSLGISMCVNTFMKIAGVRGTPIITVHNNDPVYPYTVRVGIHSSVMNTQLLEDMLSYIMPPGYFVDIYFYAGINVPKTNMDLNSKFYPIETTGVESSVVRVEKIDTSTEDIPATVRNNSLNTVQLTTVFTPPKDEEEEPNE